MADEVPSLEGTESSEQNHPPQPETDIPTTGIETEPWWMDFMRNEGLLDAEDKSVVFQNGSVVGGLDDLVEEEKEEEKGKEKEA